MAQKVRGGHYQYGSTARAYQEVAPRTLPNTKPVHQPKHQPQKSLDKAFVLKLSICGGLLFTSSLIYIGSYSKLNATQTQKKTIKNEIREIESMISLAEAKRAEKLSSDYIRERAEKELGMSLPKAHQVVYIELPKEAYTVYEQQK